MCLKQRGKVVDEYETHENFLPTSICAAEMQPVLPYICGGRYGICLDVDKIGVARPRVTSSAKAQGKKLMKGDIVGYLSEK